MVIKEVLSCPGSIIYTGRITAAVFFQNYRPGKEMQNEKENETTGLFIYHWIDCFYAVGM